MRATLLALPLFAASLAHAQPSDFFLIPGWNQAYAVSGDGRTVVGHSPNGAVSWYLPTSTQTILGAGSAFDVSGNGSVIIGNGTGGVFRWTQGTGQTPIGASSPTYYPKISRDGSTIVGSSFRWRQSTGVQPLPLPPTGGSASIYGVSANGSKIVGSASVVGGALPILWNEDLSYTIAGPLPAAPDHELSTINDDGTIAFGVHIGQAGTDAFRWTAATGIQDLGFPRSGNPVPIPTACTEDGNIFIGATFTNQCFVWRLGTEPRLMADILTEDFGIDLGDLQIFNATDISADGRVIVGIGQHTTGAPVAWVVRLSNSIPAPSSGLALLAAGLLATRRRRA